MIGLVYPDNRPAPAIPYTDQYRYCQGLSPMMEQSLLALGVAVCEGHGVIGFASGIAYFYLPLTDSFRARHTLFSEVEEIWLAIDLDSFLNGGEV